MDASIQPVILSGGSGTRLWPLSREAYPKQFLALTSARTLLQETQIRIHGVQAPSLPPIVVCNEDHRFVVVEQLRELGIEAAARLQRSNPFDLQIRNRAQGFVGLRINIALQQHIHI